MVSENLCILVLWTIYKADNMNGVDEKAAEIIAKITWPSISSEETEILEIFH